MVTSLMMHKNKYYNSELKAKGLLCSHKLYRKPSEA